MTTRLIVGCGYLGLRVARRWRDKGDRVVVVTRSAERAEMLRGEGLLPFVADITAEESLRGLPEAETVLVAVGYDRSAGKPMRSVYVDGLRNVLRAATSFAQLITISSTSVYGQTSGEWVDENSPCEPDTENGRICLEAEHTALDPSLQYDDRVQILRLAGIYGLGRVPRLSALLSGEPMPVPSSGFLNLIHVDDAATAVQCAASLREARHDAERCATLSRLYLISDGHPVERREYYREAARLVGAPPPKFVEPAADSPVAARAASNKRISNALAVAELRLKFAYPSYKEGLAAILGVKE